MEERNSNFLVVIVRKTGSGGQRYKKFTRTAATMKDARKIAKQLSQMYQFSSAVIVDADTELPIEFWSVGKIIE